MGDYNEDNSTTYEWEDQLVLRTPEGDVNATVISDEDADGNIAIFADKPINGETALLVPHAELDKMCISRISGCPHAECGQKKYTNGGEGKGKSEKTSDILGTISSGGCCLLWLLIPIWVVFSSVSGYIKIRKEKRIKAQREMFVRDSLYRDSLRIDSIHRDPLYIDSVKRAEEERERIFNEWYDSLLDNTLYLIKTGDSIYHMTTDCFKAADIPNTRLISRRDVERKGYNLCDKCFEYIEENDEPVDEEDEDY